MRIAFYAPLKAPDHPVPSGDRQMARLLVRALTLAGHTVDIVSRLRSFTRDPSPASQDVVNAAAQAEIARLSAEWIQAKAPDLWFCYHPYYKSPDLIGPALGKAFSIPYVTAESSYSARRNVGAWATSQKAVEAGVKQAALNICFTCRDHDGLALLVPESRLALLPPFIDTSAFSTSTTGSTPPKLVTVAMMRPGDKMESYAMLAQALEACSALPWTLSVVGDGPCRDEVHTAFAGIDPARIEWLGERKPEEISAILATGDLFVWPGFGEAYGLAYLEAQAVGLPVVAQDIAGVPEVVDNGETGILTQPGDAEEYASAITRLLTDGDARREMGEAARRFVHEQRSLEGAAARLSAMLAELAP